MKLFPMFIFYIEDELRFILICPIHEGYRKKFIKPYYWGDINLQCLNFCSSLMLISLKIRTDLFKAY